MDIGSIWRISSTNNRGGGFEDATYVRSKWKRIKHLSPFIFVFFVHNCYWWFVFTLRTMCTSSVGEENFAILSFYILVSDILHFCLCILFSGFPHFGSLHILPLVKILQICNSGFYFVICILHSAYYDNLHSTLLLFLDFMYYFYIFSW